MDKSYIGRYVFENTDDGVIGISYKGGKILFANEAAEKILENNDIVGKSILGCIPYNDINDEINQLIIDAVMDQDKSHAALVSFCNIGDIRRLQVKSYFLRENDEKIGVILILNDLTEMFRVRSTFTRYLSESIVEQLLDTKEGLRLGGKKVNATVLMSDLRGFSAMSEAMDPSSLITMINHYFEQMVDAIQKHNGTIIEFLGDGIFAVFGAPICMENHAACAVAAGIEMQQRMHEINEWNKEHGYPELMMGVGINTGDIIVGNIGSEQRAKFGAMGSSVNVAGRVESYTTEGQILISEFTRKQIVEDVDIRSEKSVKAKGINSEFMIYEVGKLGGDFQLVAPEQKVGELNQTKNQVEVDFGVLEGKDVHEFSCKAKFISVNDKFAMLSTETSLSVDTNICMKAGGELYAKVKKVEGNNVLICYTAKPAGFEEWEKCLFL